VNDLTCEEMDNKGTCMDLYESKEDLDEAHFDK
jgi:hypothetical protein